MSLSNTTPPLALGYFAPWLASGERGLSSEAIVTRLTGHRVGRYNSGRDYPHDPSDFRRCVQLLRAYPLARMYLDLMADVSPVWANFVAKWDDIVATFEDERPGALDDPNSYGPAPRTYALIREVIAR